jgi:quinol-cytochrome oxidoreductase complex cytochrome b subunit
VEDSFRIWEFSAELFYQGPRFRPLFKFFFSFWVLNFILLGFLGGKPVEFPFNELSVLVSSFYFLFFILYF